VFFQNNVYLHYQLQFHKPLNKLLWHDATVTKTWLYTTSKEMEVMASTTQKFFAPFAIQTSPQWVIPDPANQSTKRAQNLHHSHNKPSTKPSPAQITVANANASPASITKIQNQERTLNSHWLVKQKLLKNHSKVTSWLNRSYSRVNQQSPVG